jgi:hypothetical protein
VIHVRDARGRRWLLGAVANPVLVPLGHGTLPVMMTSLKRTDGPLVLEELKVVIDGE